MKKKLNIRIKNRIKTNDRRKDMNCKIYALKIDGSKLSLVKKNYLESLFGEAKWEYNFALSSNDVFKYDYKTTDVKIKNKEGNLEDRKISTLSSQMKQSIADSLKQNILNLSKAKKKGIQVGQLKFKSQIKRIPLKQYGATYKFNDTGRYLKLQGNKSWFKIFGFSQIPKDVEFANANLIKQPSGYYVKVTCFVPKQKRILTNKSIGVDFGISSSLTLSSGEKICLSVPVSKKVKLEHKKLSRKIKGSRNYYKQKNKLELAYEKQNNIKKDLRNKIVSRLVKDFDVIAVQDENIKGWQSGWFGKQISESALGGIMSDLKRKSYALKVVKRFVPTTKGCYVCGEINSKNDLSQRTFICEHCGFSEDRDIHSARMILKLVGGEPTDFKPVEIKTSNSRPQIESSQVCEAGIPMALAVG